MIGNEISVFVFAVKVLTVISVLKYCGKEFDYHSVAVTLVAAECLADTAECGKSGSALTNSLKCFACVALNRFAV